MAFFYYYNPPLQPLSQYLFQGLSHGGRGLAETHGIDSIKFFEGVRFTIYLQGGTFQPHPLPYEPGRVHCPEGMVKYLQGLSSKLTRRLRWWHHVSSPQGT